MTSVPSEVFDEAPSLESIVRLRKDLRQLDKLPRPEDIRYLVDQYYATQEYRIGADAQVRAASEGGEPHEVLVWLADQAATVENQIRRVLDWYTDVEPTGMGVWAKSQVGIGPVISAGLLAHIDITQAPTVGHIWSFAGYDPRTEWLSREKAQAVVKTVADRGPITDDQVEILANILGRNVESLKRMARFNGRDKPPLQRPTVSSAARALARRPWNAKFKVLCWKAGQSFVKVSNKPDALYGQLYRSRKNYEIARNMKGGNKEAAAEILRRKNIGHETEAYKAYIQGMLPPAQIDARARRYAVKMFLSHWWEVAYHRHYRTDPPRPFAIAVLGHNDYLPPPPPAWDSY
jgi:hypothetical protein